MQEYPRKRQNGAGGSHHACVHVQPIAGGGTQESRTTCRERADRRDQPAFSSELLYGPEGTHAAVELPGDDTLIPDIHHRNCPIKDNICDCGFAVELPKACPILKE
jgi:hypothetical protein